MTVCKECNKELHVNRCICPDLGKPGEANYIECYRCHLNLYHISKGDKRKAEVVRP